MKVDYVEDTGVVVECLTAIREYMGLKILRTVREKMPCLGGTHLYWEAEQGGAQIGYYSGLHSKSQAFLVTIVRLCLISPFKERHIY